MTKDLEIYKNLSTPPHDALKAIAAGRLKGKSDINPQWRIEALTQQFGLCGFGWKYQTVKDWTLQGANGEIATFVRIFLYVKIGDVWSEGIEGTGGSMFVANEKNGAYTSDEAYKMATTDAISVAAKFIGVGADVYRGKMNGQHETTKYT